MKALRAVLVVLMLCPALYAAPIDLAAGFQAPPPEARPWVYWFWLNGNITREGVTADLEAMARVGVGGVLIMEVDQGAPPGPVPFMSDAWRELFSHVVKEADRLGLEVNMNNDAGWNGSGGPWITPEESMQRLVWTETAVPGGQRFEGRLPQPETVAGYYRDIAVLAFPTPGPERVDNLPAKSAQVVSSVSPAVGQATPAGAALTVGEALDLTGRTGEDGRLAWDAPPGNWTVLRLGHTSTGVMNAPAPESGRGLECDKLSAAGIEANFERMMGKLIDDAGPLAGKSLAATHIDSWENGSQNWTAGMAEAFRVRRSYDLAPYLPACAGYIVVNAEVTERFLRDLRQTVSDLVVENYAGRMRELANERGLRFTVEAYGAPCDSLPYAGRSDEPMSEFWIGGGAMDTAKWMASAAHAYGKPVVGAEAFTAADQERWLEHPASIKALGDRAFCDGVNRFVFHRYAMQPWIDRAPGMTMGPWGIHYERTQTWWEETGPWHDYLSRCQYLLRQGRFVADLCFLQTEARINAFEARPARGYDYDFMPVELVLSAMSVEDGQLVLPGGMRYRLLVLPGGGFMTPELLSKVTRLVHDGATVLGDPPERAPGLTDYPMCDNSVRQLAAALWAECDGVGVKERRFGAGRVLRGMSPEEALGILDIRPDFACNGRLDYIHRRTDDGTDLYFVANPEDCGRSAVCTFRVDGKRPELWDPETGHIAPAPVYSVTPDGVTVPLHLGPSGSVFVVFREAADADPAVRLTRDGEAVLEAVRRAPDITVREAVYGVPGDASRSRDVRDEVARRIEAGRFELPVASLAQRGDPAEGTLKALRAVLVVDGREVVVRGQDPDTVLLDYTGPRFEVISATYGVPGDAVRTRDVREKLQRLLDSGRDTFQVAEMARGDDPAFMVVKTLVVEYVLDGQKRTVRGTDQEELRLATPEGDVVTAELARDGATLALYAREPGAYEVALASGETATLRVDAVPGPVEVAGPWTLRFPEGSGAPAEVTMDPLRCWCFGPEEGVKHFSGTAVYTTRFDAPEPAADTRWTLDLGDVRVMARVTLNGEDLGLLWRPPFTVDVTGKVRPGENTLQVAVTNLWVNRMIGDESLPEDSDRNDNGTLKAWPEWIESGEPSPTGRFTFTSWRLWRAGEPIQPSGLIGPVRLTAEQVVEVN